MVIANTLQELLQDIEEFIFYDCHEETNRKRELQRRILEALREFQTK